MRNLPLLPSAASTFAVQSDALFWVLMILTVVFTVLVGCMIAFLSVRYRRGNPVDRSRPPHHNTLLELSWSVGPLFLALAVFVWAAKLFAVMFGPAPKDAMNIFVVGKQWMWHLQHPNGIRENDELHVPVGRTVKLTMISQDVIHDFSLPDFRVKRDVIPGIYTTIWFTPTQTGKFHFYCAQYCGTNHSQMTGYVYVMEPSEFQRWLASGGQRTQDTQPLPRTMAERGAAVYAEQGCGNCHDSQAGGRGVLQGPSLSGLYGTVVRLKGGGMERADDAYLRRKIMESDEQIDAQYQQVMPAYKGSINEEQMLDLIEYIKSLSAPPGSQPSGTTAPPPTATARTGRRVRQMAATRL